MLFALYASIQALTQADADRAARLQLTGIYHTLLRLWAETGPTTHHDLPQRDLPAALVLRHHRRHRARHRRRHRRHPQLRGRTAEGTEPRGDDGPAARRAPGPGRTGGARSEEHTSELQSLMRISYAVFCLKKKKKITKKTKENNKT